MGDEFAELGGWGTYQVPNTNTLVANGRLGTGFWHRRP
jgi:hypothetical protein